MNNIQNYAYANPVALSTGTNQVAFTGEYTDKIREKAGNYVIKQLKDYRNWRYGKGGDERFTKFTRNIVSHILYQGGVIGSLEAISPSPNILSFMVRKCMVDFAELIPKSCKDYDMKIKHSPLNILSYLNYIKNKVIR